MRPARATPAAASTDEHQPPSAVGEDLDEPLDVVLIARAGQAAAEHRRQTGTGITRDQLRAALRVSNRTAGRLLHLVRTTPDNSGARVMAPSELVIR